MRLIRLLVPFGLVLGLGCDATSPRDELRAAMRRWSEWGYTSYDLTIVTTCSHSLVCDGVGIRGRVRDGVMVSQVRLDTGEEVRFDVGRATVESLFEGIERGLSLPLVRQISADYHEVTGHPRATRHEQIMDGTPVLFTTTTVLTPVTLRTARGQP